MTPRELEARRRSLEERVEALDEPMRSFMRGVVDGLVLVELEDYAGAEQLGAAKRQVRAIHATPAGRAALARLGNVRQLGARLVHARTCAAFLRWAAIVD